MIFGFSQRRQIISESDAPLGELDLSIDVHSLRRSEIEYEVFFHIMETGNATVEAFNMQFQLHFDALFGTRDDRYDCITDSRTLEAGTLNLTNRLRTRVINDLFPEDPIKCYDIQIMSPDAHFYSGIMYL